jgi:acetyl esterase/lipase
LTVIAFCPFIQSNQGGSMKSLCLRIMMTSVLFLCASVASAQFTGAAEWASFIENQYRVVPDVTYLTANNWDAKLDLYVPAGSAGPHPAVIYFHGGGWTAGSKEGSVLRIAPYLEMGLAVVNVEYRLARVSLAPAAVEDGLCALRWVIRNAMQYNIDVNKLVVTGHSAGGHLALTTGMIPASAGLDRQCPGNENLKVAAIVNWYGITDVGELLDGPNMKTYAVTWMGSLSDRNDIAKRVSPLTYVRKDLPPIITIQGDADPTVPYSHGVRLHKALADAGVAQKHVTIPGGRHGGFSRDENLKAYAEIRAFLAKYGIVKAGASN